MPATAPRRPRARVLAAAALCASLAVAPAAQAAPLESSQIVDSLGRPTPAAVAAVHDFAAQPFVPPQVGDALRAAVNFFAGTGELGGPDLPAAGPEISQFAWPTVSPNCMGPGLNSTASAIAVPGPTEIPAPGAAAGQAAFVFTALGTPPAAAEQGGMNVYWVNIDNHRYGVAPLGNNGINPQGPATLSGTADTGAGTVVAIATGSVRTVDNECGFAPTANVFRVR